MSKKVKKALAVLGLTAVSALSVAPTYAGILIDSAGKNKIDAAEADIEEIGGATILVSALIWGIRATRRI